MKQDTNFRELQSSMQAFCLVGVVKADEYELWYCEHWKYSMCILYRP